MRAVRKEVKRKEGRKRKYGEQEGNKGTKETGKKKEISPVSFNVDELWSVDQKQAVLTDLTSEWTESRRGQNGGSSSAVSHHRHSKPSNTRRWTPFTLPGDECSFSFWCVWKWKPGSGSAEGSERLTVMMAFPTVPPGLSRALDSFLWEMICTNTKSPG